ncbi:MAG: bifunctional UDP-N-acetylglucosamine diphosphorylase/glucosamine-1-phosphate N-acetyltransferase GlmU [Vicinamibacterales bacterium]
MDLYVVILAAGKGTRMKSAQPKVVHALAGRPIIEHVLRTVDALRAAQTVLVVGHGADQVKAALAGRQGLQFVMQAPQLGTGHAVQQTESVLGDRAGTLLLLYGDVPLLSSGTLQRLLESHRNSRAAATVLTAEIADPYGYGRIVRDADGAIARIAEERDASGAERAIREINSGIYAFDLAPLFPALHELESDNAQGERYLTDLVALYRRKGLRVGTLCLESAEELRGVNSRADLADLTAVVRARKNRAVMLAGATLEDPSTTYIDEDVTIGADTIIGPGVTLEGRTTIGERCRIRAGARLTHATVGHDATILDGSIVIDSAVGDGAAVGPYAHLRPDSTLGPGARVGNFVELKKTTMGARSKANHLAYLGDSTIGEDVNVGAGTITCNYDGVKKHPTVLEDGVFVGSDSQLVAPVRVGKGAYVAAGSTVTEDVPADALAISRNRQTIKPGWAAARRAARQKPKA